MPTMRPLPLRRDEASCIAKNVPLVMAKSRSNISSVVAPKGSSAPTPALAIRISTPPNRSVAASKACLALAESVASAAIAKAYSAIREVMDARGVWAEIDALDGRIAEAVQIDALLKMWDLLRNLTRWLLNHRGADLDIAGLVARYAPGVAELRASLPDALTAIGRAIAVPLRSGAQVGDALYVTGTVGDAGAGLRIARGEDGPAELLAAYRRPQPRLTEGRALAPLVHAMMDVSDGLLIDAARMAEASGVAVTIDLAAIPLSSAYCAFAGDNRAERLAAATAGDDYQLLFAAPADLALPIPATRIGMFMAPPTRHPRESGDPSPDRPSRSHPQEMGSRFRGNDGVEGSPPLALTDGGAPLPLPEKLGFAHGD